MKNDAWIWWVGLGLMALLIVGTGGYAIMELGIWAQSANAKQWIPLLNQAEQKYGIPSNLLARMAYQESRFRDDIIYGTTSSSAGAQGIMQIVPAYHPGVNPLDPVAAIDYAGSYLAQLYTQFGSWPLAVAAYNAGPGNVNKYGGIPPFTETQNYVSQIFGDLVNNQNGAMYA